MNNISLSQICELMIETAKSSAEIIRQNFRQNDKYENKSSHIDIVTATDLASQQNIHNRLVKGMVEMGMEEGEIGFVEEESSADNISTHNFIIDPIDGTTNFASGIAFSCISIGYAFEKDIQIGVVLEPFSNTLYWGIKGEGSWVKVNSSDGVSAEIKLSQKIKPAKQWLVGAHLNGMDVVGEQFKMYEQIYPFVRGLRNIGSLTLDLCMMADNVLDVVFNKGCYFWDLAASSVIVREAGGEIYDSQGEILQYDWQDTKKKYHLISCHPEILGEVKKMIE